MTLTVEKTVQFHGETVCVTGAGGFIASWLVKLLLEQGYNVRGTVREPGGEKNVHLENLEGAKERLKLLKANLLDYDSLVEAINGCTGVFHTASPVLSQTTSNPEVEVINPAIKGTLNVLKACSVSKVKRVIMTSSVGAVLLDPKRPRDKFVDESCWSDPEYCRATQNWYYMSKTVAEQDAWHYSEESGLDLISICPSLVLGPILQPNLNASCLVLVKLLNGDPERCENKARNIVDVRDVARAHILAYENPSAAGRYLCTAHSVRTKELVDILKRLYPQYTYPKDYVDVGLDVSGIEQVSGNKLRELGLDCMQLEQTLVDIVECFQHKGILK
jgi:nucleoside-diphosphate-sugar epimerase